jgi:hypothetical protein
MAAIERMKGVYIVVSTLTDRGELDTIIRIHLTASETSKKIEKKQYEPILNNRGWY